jgi:hypothetical protein
MTEMSRYELFSATAKADINGYRERLKGDGTFQFCEQVIQLQKLNSHINVHLLTYLFGERLGEHMAQTFVTLHERNLLSFMGRMTSEYRFFILHELKNNEQLFLHSYPPEVKA